MRPVSVLVAGYTAAVAAKFGPAARRAAGLLAGTALGSVLLAATSLALLTAAAAADQTIVFVNTVSFSEIKALLNASKPNTTLGTTINTLELSVLNNRIAHTAVFVKVDCTFADQTHGVGVSTGMRCNW